MGTRPRVLYHFTCLDHGLPGIERDGLIRPRPHPFMLHLGPLVWLTDLAVPPSPDSVGLTSELLDCDRLAKRFEVNTKAALPWATLRHRAKSEVVEALEAYGQPEHWWVVRRPLTASEFV